MAMTAHDKHGSAIRAGWHYRSGRIRAVRRKHDTAEMLTRAHERRNPLL